MAQRFPPSGPFLLSLSMQANEIRIGNKVYLTDEGVQDVVTITAASFKDTEDYEPIPLTPEILEGCGFIMDSDTYRLQDATQFILLKSDGRERIAYDIEHDVYKYMIADYGVDRKVGKAVYFLHQLQNLYFVLTGTELEVKLPQTTPNG